MTDGWHDREWEELANLDPLWAIASDPAKRHDGWRHDEFFATGEAVVGPILSWAEGHGLPARRGHALDFGCGVGRLSRALAASFDHCVGVDISPSMIDQARELNDDIANLRFAVGDAEQPLGGPFDLVLTLIVLQHLPRKADLIDAIVTLATAVAPGGVLVVEVPNHIPVRHRIQPRPRLYRFLRSVGVHSRILYGRLGLAPIRMRAVSDPEVRAVLARCGLQLVETRVSTNHAHVRVSTYLAARAELAERAQTLAQ